MELNIGSTIIIDGRALKVERFQGENVARAEDEKGAGVWFDKREAHYMGSGLFSLPGRVEAPKENAAASVTVGVNSVLT